MIPVHLPSAEQLNADVTREAQRLGFKIELFPLRHKKGTWYQLWCTDRHPDLAADAETMLVHATVHAREIAGAITFWSRLPHIVAATRATGKRLVFCPLLNPSGYDHRESGSDRNVDGDSGSGEAGNNDGLRYLLPDGTWTWNLKGRPYRSWAWSSDPRCGERLPLEMLAAHEFLGTLDWSKVAVALDLHQDFLTEGLPRGAYQYVFGNSSAYAAIARQVRRIVPVLARHGFRFDRRSRKRIRTDAHGCIAYFHDGSLSDLAYRLGARHALTIETTGATSLSDAVEVNMVWMLLLARLSAR